MANVVLLTLLTLLAASAELTGTAAGADDVQAKRTQAKAAAASLAGQARQIVELDRRHRQAQDRLVVSERLLTANQVQLATAAARQQEVHRALVAHAQLAYQFGGSVGVLGQAGRGGPTQSVARRAYLRIVTGQGREVIEEFRSTSQDLAARRSQLEVSRNRMRADTSAIAAERSSLARAVSSQRGLLAKLTGDVGRLVAAEQARRDAETARLTAARPGRPASGPQARPGAGTTTLPGGSVDEAFSCIRQLESGNNYRSRGGGAYQFQDATWQSLGYPGSATDAPPAVQDEAARKLYASRGWQPWTTAPLCGRL
ncbi:MAG: transglycosylase family protein [Acidimicrobiales bacterium]